MDDFPTSSFVSAATFGQDEHASELLAGGMGGLSLKHRVDSDTSIGTTMPAVPKSESVLVCVRVRPPAVSHTVQVVNPAHLEEAWRMDTDEGSVRLGDGSGQEYRFGQLPRLRFFCTPPALADSHFANYLDAVVTGSGNTNVYEQAAKNLIQCVLAHGPCR